MYFEANRFNLLNYLIKLVAADNVDKVIAPAMMDASSKDLSSSPSAIASSDLSSSLSSANK